MNGTDSLNHSVMAYCFQMLITETITAIGLRMTAWQLARVVVVTVVAAAAVLACV